jgi:chromosomal replication initiation ATPase DnaA
MAVPTTQLSSACSFAALSSCAKPTSDELIDTLAITLQRIIELPAGASPRLIQAARPALAAVTQMRIAARFATISDHIARDFRLGSDKLQSRSREQRVAFARQLAMFLCRKITSAPFESIGAHFRRDHCTVIHAYQAIEQRTRRDPGFRRFIEEFEGRITESIV